MKRKKTQSDAQRKASYKNFLKLRIKGATKLGDALKSEYVKDLPSQVYTEINMAVQHLQWALEEWS